MEAPQIRNAGPLLKQIREKLGLSAKEVAEAVGVAPSYLSEIETGKRNTTSAMIARMAPVLKRQPEALRDELELMQAKQDSLDYMFREPETPYRFTPTSDPGQRSAEARAIERATDAQRLGIEDHLSRTLDEIRVRLGQIHHSSSPKIRQQLITQAKARIDEYDQWVTLHLLDVSCESS